MFFALGLVTAVFAADDPPPAEPAAETPAEPAPAEPAPAEPAPAEPSPSGGPPVDLSKAEAAPELNRDDYQALKPDRDQLPPNPYAQVSYTAYTLEWGEFIVGVPTLAAGILPRTQLSTDWIYYPLCATPDLVIAACIPNLNLKLNALRAGPVDFGLQWMWSDGTIRYRLEGEAAPPVAVSTFGAGVAVSALINPKWGVHTTATWRRAAVNAEVPSGWLAGALAGALGVPEGVPIDEAVDPYSVDVWHQDVLLKIATDVHFSRKRVFIAKGQALVWSSTPYEVSSGEKVEIGGKGEGDRTFWQLFGQTYVGELDYQISYRAADFWVGVRVQPSALTLLSLGVPALPVYPTIGMNLRLGGKTRAGERRMLRSWRKNNDDVQ